MKPSSAWKNHDDLSKRRLIAILVYVPLVSAEDFYRGFGLRLREKISLRSRTRNEAKLAFL